MLLRKPFLIGFLSLSILKIVHAQPGTIDPTFNPGDVGNGYGDGPNGMNVQVVLPDGKLMIGGGWTFVHGQARNRMARLNSDGTLDPSFDPGLGLNDQVRAMVQQPDGKWIVGGDFTTCAGVARNRIARLNSDGSFDATFNPGAGFDFAVKALALQADGKVVVGGNFHSFNGTTVTKLVRLLANGMRDTGFTPGTFPGSATSGVLALTVASSGHILVGGEFSNVGGIARPGFAKLNTDGSLVPDFPAAGLPYLGAHTIIIQPDGKLLLGVFASVKRLNADGTLDASYVTTNVTGGSLTPSVQQVILQPDGKAILWGGFKNYNGTPVYCSGMARVNVDGSLDPSFQAEATGRMALLPDGDIILMGSIKLNPDGSKDQAYCPGTGFNRSVRCILTQPDGSILVGGNFNRYQGQDANALVRLGPTGVRDAGFQPPFPSIPDQYYNHEVRNMVLQPDGKLIVGRGGLVRLNPDGSLDPSFDDGEGTDLANTHDMALALLPDGKILVGGEFQIYNGYSRRGLVRLHANGAFDESFNANAPIGEGYVNDLAVQTDGRILIVGMGGVKRLNADGSLDGSFDGPSLISYPSTGDIQTVDLLPDGRVLIGGSFHTCDGQPRPGIARLLADGSLDGSFNPTGPDIYQLYAVAVQSDGRIVIGGFNGWAGTPRKSIARLNTDGSVDASFNSGTGFTEYDGSITRVEALALQADGQVLVGGSFTSYNATGRNRIARLNGDGAAYVDLAAKVFLDGPYNPAIQLMNDGLRANGMLLADEPYTTLGYEQVGNGATTLNAGVVSTTGNNAIVDWVLMELRDRDDATNVLASRSALVQRDGDVVDVDGHSPVRFDAAPDNYFVSVKHRNHLGAMSAGTCALGPQAAGLDLTHPGLTTYGTDGRRPVGGRMTLWPGDVTFNGQVKYTGTGNDRDPILISVGSFTPNVTITGYRQEDVNLDGVVKYTGSANDRDPILVTVGGTVPTNVRMAQLP